MVAVALSEDGGIAISLSSDRTSRVWQLATGQALATLETHAPLVCCAAVPGGRTFVAGDEAGGMHILDWVDAEHNGSWVCRLVDPGASPRTHDP